MRSRNPLGAPIGMSASGRSGKDLLDERITESDPEQTLATQGGAPAEGSSAPHLPGTKGTCYPRCGRANRKLDLGGLLAGGDRMMIGRRSFLASGTCVIAAAVGEASLGLRPSFGQDARNLGPNRLVTLGTRGGPPIRTGFTPSPAANLIVFDNVAYVIDTGYGASFKLVESKFPLPQLRYIFITHHHSDHNAEFGLLVYNAWVTGLKTPIDAYGPVFMKRLAQGFWDAYQFDIETRMADEGRPDVRKLVNIHEYTEGEVLKTDKVRVSALRNSHPPITESFALKFEFPGKTVVFSGDTAYHPPL